MKKEFYFDVDGVILDFETSFMGFIRDKYRPDLPADYQPRHWELWKEFPDIDMEEAWKGFVSSDRFAELDLLVTSETFNQLTNGFPTYLVTNIPNDLVDKRKRNLSGHSLNYTDLYCAGHWDFGIKDYPSKSGVIKQLHQNNNPIIFLDDHPTNCGEVAKNIPDAHVFLMHRKHNEENDDSNEAKA